jgi:hypothetical protein
MDRAQVFNGFVDSPQALLPADDLFNAAGQCFPLSSRQAQASKTGDEPPAWTLGSVDCLQKPMEDIGLSGLMILICDFANKHVPENSTRDFE